MGRNAYRVVHTEGGFPQIYYHWPFSIWPGLMEFVGAQEDIYGLAPFFFTGSSDPDYLAHLRSPIELGWSHMVKFDHEFTGRAALQAEMAAPRRAMVTLEWNPDDILGIYQSQFNRETAATPMGWSDDFDFYHGNGNVHVDKVVDSDGNTIGLSSGRMFSPFYRQMISLCSIDVAYAKLGTEVTLVWGERGTPQRNIRATVARFPYVDEGRNEKVDTNTIPRLAVAQPVG